MNHKVDFKIDGKTPLDVKKSFNCSYGKDGQANKPYDRPLPTHSADDTREVRGFGQPITPALTKDIVLSYFKKSELAWSGIQKIENGEFNSIAEIIESPEFIALKFLLRPESQIVSGVFGKESILHLIAQKNCEGIRYFIGEMQNKLTIVLVGVRDTGKFRKVEMDGQMVETAVSEPLAGKDYYKKATAGAEINATIPPDTEVHKSSMTRKDIKELFGFGIEDPDSNIVDGLFGAF